MRYSITSSNSRHRASGEIAVRISASSRGVAWQKRTGPSPSTSSATVSGAPATPAGPSVRVFRGQAVTVQPIANAARGMVDQQAKGVGRAAKTVPGATAASLMAG